MTEKFKQFKDFEDKWEASMLSDYACASGQDAAAI